MAYDIAVVFGYAAISAILAYIAMNVDKRKHGILQLLFLFMSLYGTWATVGAIQAIIEIEGQTQLQGLNTMFLTVLFWGTFTAMAYVFVMFLWNLWSLKKNKKQGGGPTPEEVYF